MSEILPKFSFRQYNFDNLTFAKSLTLKPSNSIGINYSEAGPFMIVLVPVLVTSIPPRPVLSFAPDI